MRLSANCKRHIIAKLASLDKKWDNSFKYNWQSWQKKLLNAAGINVKKQRSSSKKVYKVWELQVKQKLNLCANR